MLIILPPSETQRPTLDHGLPVVLDDLSFPSLSGPRARVLDALITTSARSDACQRLRVRPSLAAEVARNTRLPELPAVPVLDLYSGPLYEGLSSGSLPSAAASRAEHGVVVTSALWGVVRPVDRVPPHRLHVCARLVGLDRLQPFWRTFLGDVLAEAAGDGGVVVDLRSPSYQALGLPTGLGQRTVVLRVESAGGAGGRIGDVVAKRIRGRAARHLLESGADPDAPEALADLLAERWPVRLDIPARPGRAWTLTVGAIGDGDAPCEVDDAGTGP